MIDKGVQQSLLVGEILEKIKRERESSSDDLLGDSEDPELEKEPMDTALSESRLATDITNTHGADERESSGD